MLTYTLNVGMVISLSDVISIEDFLSPQIADASSIDKYALFSRLSKHLLTELRMTSSIG
jgi:hypothetical protein